MASTTHLESSASLFPFIGRKENRVKTTWNGHSVQAPPISHGAPGAGLSLLCYFAISGIIFALGVALTITGIMGGIASLEIAGEALIITALVTDLFAFLCCASCCTI